MESTESSDQSVLDQMISRLVDALDPVAIYLFGSEARGEADRHSDIDLLVVIRDGQGHLRDLAARGRASLWGMGMPVDLVICTSSELAKWSSVACNLIHTATHEGRQVYASAG